MKTIFIVLNFITTSFAYAGLTCTPNSTTSLDPFYVISNSFYSNTEVQQTTNFQSKIEQFVRVQRPVKNGGGVAYVPNRSLIDAPTARNMNPNVLIQSQVLSIADEEIFGTILRNKKTYITPQGLPKIKAQEIGGILNRHLRPAKDYAFIIDSDAPQRIIVRNTMLKLSDHYLKPQMTGDMYNLSRCCDTSKTPARCENGYTFNIYAKANGRSINSTLLIPKNFRFMSDLHPTVRRDMPPLLKLSQILGQDISKFEIMESRGLIQFPKSIDRIECETSCSNPSECAVCKTIGPFDSFSYGQGDSDFDKYGSPIALCSFAAVLKSFKPKCSGVECQIQYGDISRATDPYFDSHRQHTKGYCFDVRPIKKPSSNLPDSGINYRSANYDREATRDFIELVIRAGATTVFFNDMTIITPIKKSHPNLLIRSEVEHDDHIHFCLDPKNVQVANTCSNKSVPN